MKFITLLIIFIALNIMLPGCKKNVLDSKYASALQNKWQIKSHSKRSTIVGSYQGPWITTQAASGAYREFRSDGTWTVTVPGFSYTGIYQLMSDSVVLLLNPVTGTTTYAPPDTTFIRFINESVYVSYNRKYYSATNYLSIDESIDSLIR
jgi:hypothetical protein